MQIYSFVVKGSKHCRIKENLSYINVIKITRRDRSSGIEYD